MMIAMGWGGVHDSDDSDGMGRSAQVPGYFCPEQPLVQLCVPLL